MMCMSMMTSPPLAGGGWGEGAVLAPLIPSPNPLPQGEGESLEIVKLENLN